MIKSKKNFKYGIEFVFLLTLGMMLIIMLPSMLANHGIFIIRGDYIEQYIPRIIKGKNIFSNGGLATWDWFNFLGAPYNTFGTLANTNTICRLFPQQIIPYAVTYLNILRFGMVSVTAYMYLSVMLTERKYIALGSILYAFSSYTFINLEFMQFIDSVWIFPLLLLSVEKLFVEKKNKHYLIYAVILSSMCSLYFTVFSTILFTIYFLCRFFLGEEWRTRRNVKYFAIAVTEYILGIMSTAIIYAPFVYSIFNTVGSVDRIGTKISLGLLLYDSKYMGKIFAFIIPAISNSVNSFANSRWMSFAAYLPVFGISFFVAHCLKYRGKQWIDILVLVLMLFVAIPAFGMIFNMFSSTYTRWIYGLALFIVLASMKFIEEYDYKYAKIGVYISIFFVVAMLAKYYLTSFRIIEMPNLFRLFGLLSICLFYIILFGFLHTKIVKQHILTLVVCSIVVYGMGYVYINSYMGGEIGEYEISMLDINTKVKKYYSELPQIDDDSFYRIDHSLHCYNYSYVMNKPAISIFESQRNKYTEEFAEYADYDNTSVRVSATNQSNALRTLLGTKYYIDIYPEDGQLIPEGFTYLKTDKGCNIYANDNYIGMGFTYSTYITRSQLDEIAKTTDNCSDIMLNALVIDDDDIDKVDDILEPYDFNNSSLGRRFVAEDFVMNNVGFSAKIIVEEPSLVYFSVPYERKGWTATVNGEKTEIIKANVGMLAVKTEAGTNEINFKYLSPSIKPGIIISLLGIILTILYVFIYNVCVKNDKNNIL